MSRISTTTAFNKNVKCYKIITNDKDLISTFSKQKNFVIEKVSKHLKQFQAVKWYIDSMAEVVKLDMKKATPYFYSKLVKTTIQKDIEKQYMKFISFINESFEKYLREGSG